MENHGGVGGCVCGIFTRSALQRLLELLGAGSVDLGEGELVDGQTLNDAVGAVRVGADGLGVDDVGGQV